MIKVLSIAGSDPSGGAGIQLDLKVFQALGAFGMAVPAALTAQNSSGVRKTYPVNADAVYEQIETLLSDTKPDAMKTGMLLTKENVEAVAAAVKKFRLKNLIIDPVLCSSSGASLLRSGAIASLKTRLFPLALLITPNIPEAEALTGISITDQSAMERAARRLLDMGPSYALIKGGHGRGPAVDTLYGGKMVMVFSTPRRRGEFHGTGCAISAAIAVFIGSGYAVEKAVEKAKKFVDSLFAAARPIGKAQIRYFQF